MSLQRDTWSTTKSWVQTSSRPVPLHVHQSVRKDNKIALQSTTDHARTGYTDTLCFSCDLTLDPMTLTYKLDLKIPDDVPSVWRDRGALVKLWFQCAVYKSIYLLTYLHTENKLSRLMHSKFEALQTDRRTDRHMRPNALRRRIRGRGVQQHSTYESLEKCYRKWSPTSEATTVADSTLTTNEMKVQWLKVCSKTDYEHTRSNTPCKQIQPLSRVKSLDGSRVRVISPVGKVKVYWGKDLRKS